MYRYLIFDLNGTLNDPKVGIIHSFKYALKSCGLKDLDETITTDYSWLVTSPLKESLRKLAGNGSENDDLVERLVGEYRKRFETIGMFENSLYPGIKELIGELSKNKANRKLIVATARPTIYAKKILEHYDLDGMFDFVIGSEFDGKISEKSG
ncbi:MAG: HAD hydrolase-like protein [Nitrososphaerales archaeon]